MDNFINLRMLSHPINWVLVWLVLLFAGFFWREAHRMWDTPSAAIPD